GGLCVGERAALAGADFKATFSGCCVAALALACLTAQAAGQDFGAHDAPAPGAPVGVHALECGPAAEHVGTDRVLLEDLGAGRDHDFDDEFEPVGAAVPGQDARVGPGRGELVVAAGAVLPAAVVLVPPGQQVRLAMAQGLQAQGVGGVVAQPGPAGPSAGAVVQVQDVVVATEGAAPRLRVVF